MTTDTRVQTVEDLEEEEGSLGLKSEDLQLPRLRFSGKTGAFSFVGDEGSKPSVVVVPIRVLQETRIKFAADEDSDEIECRSNNNIVPVNATQAAKIDAGPDCQNCQYAQFTTDDKGKRRPPACTKFVNVAMAGIPPDPAEGEEQEEPLAFIFSAKATSIKPLLQGLNAIEFRRNRSKPRLPAYAYCLLLEAGAQTGEGRRQYYPLKVSLSGTAPEELRESFRGIWHFFAQQHSQLDMTSDSVAAAAAGEPVARPVEHQAQPVQAQPRQSQPMQPRTRAGQPVPAQQPEYPDDPGPEEPFVDPDEGDSVQQTMIQPRGRYH